MTPEPGNDLEAEGVLNPATGHTPDGELYLLPRLVASGNVSRVGLAKVELRTVYRPASAAKASCSLPTKAGSAD